MSKVKFWVWWFRFEFELLRGLKRDIGACVVLVG